MSKKKKKQQKRRSTGSASSTQPSEQSSGQTRGRQAPPPSQKPPRAEPLPPDDVPEKPAPSVEKKPPPPTPAPPSLPSLREHRGEPDDSLVEAMEQRWQAFSELEDYHEKVAMFRATVDEGLMDEENAIEMMISIFEEGTADYNDHDTFVELIELVRERLPDIYDIHVQYYLEQRATSAVISGKMDRLPAIMQELAEHAPDHVELYFNTLDMLIFYEQSELVAESLRITWPEIVKSSDLIGEEEIRVDVVYTIMLDYMQHTDQPSASDPALLKRLAPIAEADPDTMARWISRVRGTEVPTWSLSDFDLTPKQPGKGGGKKPRHLDSTALQHLHDLVWTFIGYLHREEGVAYVKGYVAANEFHRYIQERYHGDLVQQRNMLERPLSLRTDIPSNKPTRPDHVLCPDGETFDVYAGRLFGLFSPKRYKAATLMELLPAWLRFLEACQLLDADQHASAYDELREVIISSGLLWVNAEDQAPHHALRRAWNLSDEMERYADEQNALLLKNVEEFARKG